jgi:hypothetical protein
LVAYAAVSHVAANLGLGQHLAIVEENPSNLIQVALLCNIGESLAIMACTLGKTSFALTLLRIVIHRWMIALLWFVIVTMNVVNILAALFVFVQCKDPRHLWNPRIPSECWPSDIFTNFSLFVGGKAMKHSAFAIWTLTTQYSILRGTRFRPCTSTLDNRLGFTDEEKREVWRGVCNEPWNIVSPLSHSLFGRQ